MTDEMPQDLTQRESDWVRMGMSAAEIHAYRAARVRMGSRDVEHNGAYDPTEANARLVEAWDARPADLQRVLLTATRPRQSHRRAGRRVAVAARADDPSPRLANGGAL